MSDNKSAVSDNKSSGSDNKSSVSQKQETKALTSTTKKMSASAGTKPKEEDVVITDVFDHYRVIKPYDPVTVRGSKIVTGDILFVLNFVGEWAWCFRIGDKEVMKGYVPISCISKISRLFDKLFEEDEAKIKSHSRVESNIPASRFVAELDQHIRNVDIIMEENARVLKFVNEACIKLRTLG